MKHHLHGSDLTYVKVHGLVEVVCQIEHLLHVGHGVGVESNGLIEGTAIVPRTLKHAGSGRQFGGIGQIHDLIEGNGSAKRM